ncbi:MAG: hypothetical protein KQH63_04780 [Desulfobulbaceae bacterium]|nr:hypothetical protein [Desulfobulbaceae bacterium]
MPEIDEKTLKSLYSRKKQSLKKHPPIRGSFWSFEEFKEWYTQQYSKEAKCYYCGIPESIIEKIYWDIKGTKRPRTRTRLELDRLDPFGNYNAKNVVLACFNCNNSKSDIFSAEEFKAIGKEIRLFWEKISSEHEVV